MVKVYWSKIVITAVSGHTEATRAQERTEAQPRGPGNVQFPIYVKLTTFPFKSYRLIAISARCNLA